MKNMISYKVSIGLFVLVEMLFLNGCTKFVAIDPPVTQVEAKLVFAEDGAAIAAITGLYSRMTQTNMNFTSGALTQYPGLSADECAHSVSSTDNDLFLFNNLVPDNGTGNYVRLWRSGYQIIYNANVILEGLQQSTGLTDSVKRQLQGEALVVRSLCYFYLVNLYGAIPLTTTSNYINNQSLARTNPTLVYRQMVADLVLAKSLLKLAYPTANRARPNRFTAAALLSRVYLYQKDWQKAEAEATEIIQNNSYQLSLILNNVFLQTSTETIWQLAKDNGNTGEGFTFVPTSTTSKPGYTLTNQLLAAFEAGDQRKTAWVGKNIMSSTEYYYPFKYKVRTTTPITEYYVVFRLAEQYLIRAEARAMMQNLTGAKGDLDRVRNRAGLSGTNATTIPGFVSALEKERRIELFLEWGHRWLDLKRWGQADTVLAIVKGANWQSTDALYPIPLREMQTNTHLTQNSGY
jgi:starch-binding outer membrane protein, SusD/RagB family